jgi:hypothetical protein
MEKKILPMTIVIKLLNQLLKKFSRIHSRGFSARSGDKAGGAVGTDIAVLRVTEGNYNSNRRGDRTILLKFE